MIREDLQKIYEEIGSDFNYSFHDNFQLFKKEVLDYSFKRYNVQSVAELGCVYGVDCAYGLYVLDKYHPTRVFMVDTHWTDAAKKKCNQHKEIMQINDNFSDPSVPAKIGNIDAVILFDVLLHQVAPDWDRVLQVYSNYTKMFLIVEPIYMASPITIRLLDLGKDEYFKNVPHAHDHPTYTALFEKMYEMNPDHNRIWRDVHHVWQWGITKDDLINKLNNLGFSLEYLKCRGRFGKLTNFNYYSFLFVKK